MSIRVPQKVNQQIELYIKLINRYREDNNRIQRTGVDTHKLAHNNQQILIAIEQIRSLFINKNYRMLSGLKLHLAHYERDVDVRLPESFVLPPSPIIDWTPPKARLQILKAEVREKTSKLTGNKKRYSENQFKLKTGPYRPPHVDKMYKMLETQKGLENAIDFAEEAKKLLGDFEEDPTEENYNRLHDFMHPPDEPE